MGECEVMAPPIGQEGQSTLHRKEGLFFCFTILSGEPRQTVALNALKD